MKTRGAVLQHAPGKWDVVDVEFDEPRQNELQLRMVAAGLCHSDEHMASRELEPGLLPFLGGHEGAGVVERVGPNTSGWEIGDHVVLSFVPACGTCRWCASGRQYICDAGARMMTGMRADGSLRATVGGRPAAQGAGLGTFCEHIVVDVCSAVKIDKDVPLERAVLLGCGVGTGWGSAVNMAETKPGETIIVMGIGGIGINAVQGASHAGALRVIAVDPVEFKRTKALEMGATHVFADMQAATEFARSVTNGQGADAAIVTVGVTTEEHYLQAFSAIRKGGIVVATGVGSRSERVNVPAMELTMYHKRIQGAVFGGSNSTRDIPWMLDMYRNGQLKLDELVTSTYPLEQINEGYADMHAGRNIRGVIVF